MDKLDEIIKLLKIQIELLDKIYKIFSKYDDEYLKELEKDGIKNP